MSRVYELCGYAVESYPEWRCCERPVKWDGQGAVRCPEHRARLPYWPGGLGDLAAAVASGAGGVGPVHSCAPESPCPVLSGATCDGPRMEGGELVLFLTAEGA